MQFDELNNVVASHFKKYPNMRLADIIKLLYQAEFGSEYAAFNEVQILDSVKFELQTMSKYAKECPIVDALGSKYARIFLSVFFQTDLDINTFGRFLLLSFSAHASDFSSLDFNLQGIIELLRYGLLPFDEKDVENSLTVYRKKCYPPIRHSLIYKTLYLPSYRVVDKVFGDLIDLFCLIDKIMKERNSVIIALDGQSGSGKSALARIINSVYLCNVITMDDFFLQKNQKTAERFNEIGGNIDYERFANSVKTPLSKREDIIYSRYDCNTGELSTPITLKPSKITVIEGVYSMHPDFIGMYDIKVFLSINRVQQRERILKRSEKMYERYINEWKEYEDKYFEYYNIEALCDFSYDTSSGGYSLKGRNEK